jgi:GT2 family glycosyltransferase
VDFCRRLLGSGHRIRYVPDAVFRHEGGASLEALGARTFERVFAANRRRYVRKHHGRLAAALVGGLGIAGAAMRGVARAVKPGR